MRSPTISPKDLRRLAWLNGYAGVADLARQLNVARQTLYAATSNPKHYGPTLKALHDALPKR